jgi:hypothetical protein
MLFTIKNNPRIADLLVTLGEQNSTIRLSNSLYNFLVGRVIRYMDGPAVTGTIFFDGFCESPEKTKEEKIKFLKSIGETSLILVGLLPGQISSLRGTAEDYRELGKYAYLSLSAEFGGDQLEKRKFYIKVAQEFDSMETVLNCARGLESEAERKYRQLYAQRVRGTGPRNDLNRPTRGGK